ncbi:Csp1 family four helix bundle copper storage protein [Leptospira fluminis]|uniref:Csp1 family four helix bundle copper storage protein n=1 Tax=Leptospira fluminis TaxID=2484979 RepID=A0A4R9GRS6_9LEPT|nr:Csp1 family four helix bundle copper storage protein [Leptospira fluminis]TGK19244.1 Csp1 family four helix bundle copper storage protein [Leptospira fluminis]
MKHANSAISAASECILKGELCIAMCIDQLSQGRSEMSDCLRSVEETVALCRAFLKLASLNSNSTKRLASICLEVCEACSRQCDKHSEHHEECGECSTACKNCVTEFKKLTA